MSAPWSSNGLVTANALASYWSGQITLCGKATSSSPTQTDTTYTIPSVKLASVLQSSSSTKTPSVLSVNDNGIEISLMRVNGKNKLTYTGKSITGTTTGSMTFTKTHSAQTISLKLYYDFAGAISVYITDSTGPRSESQGGSWSVVSDTYTVTVPAKTSYTVTYNANGGVNPPPNATKWYGETLTLSTSRVNPSRTNYEFWHWNTKSDNTGTSYGIGGSYTANAAATLYAIWNPIISYNANGGTGAPASQTKTYGTDLTLSSTKPTRTGLTFAGWGTSSTATTASYAAGAKYTSNSAATLYAIWKYTVNFNGNGNGVNPAAQTAVYGYNVTIAGYPTRSGYRFLGWNTSADGTGTHYAPGTAVAVNENCTLYAQWRKVTVSSVNVTRNVRAVGFTSTWSCSSTVGGTVTVTAQYSLDDGANWHDCILTGDATKTKVAGTDLSGTVSWASTADEDVAVRVMVTAKFTDTYSSTSISGGHDETAQRGGTIPKEFRLFDALHGGTGLAIGTIATLASTLEVGLTSLLNGVVMVMQGNLTRDGQNTAAANGDHPIQFVDSSRRQMSYIDAHKTNNSPNNYLRLTAIGPSGSNTANLYISASDTEGRVSTDASVTAPEATITKVKSTARGVNYITGANGNAALYAPKSTTNQWYPAVCLDTNGGGSWSIGNYNDEALEFVYATKANRDSSTNTVSKMKLLSGNGTIYTTVNKPTPADIGAQPEGSYVTFPSGANSSIITPGGTTQAFSLYSTVVNTANTTLNGKRVGLFMNNTNIALYNSTGSTWLWTAYTTQNPQPPEKWDVYKSTTVSQVITAERGRTVSSVTYAEWGKVAMLSVSISGWAASTGSQTGGTVVSGKRPVYNVYATDVSSSYATFAQLTTSGALTVYWGTAPGTSTSYAIRFIYILA